MKTFGDLKVGDSYYEIVNKTIYKNSITRIEKCGPTMDIFWIDNNGASGATSVPTNSNFKIGYCSCIIDLHDLIKYEILKNISEM